MIRNSFDQSEAEKENENEKKNEREREKKNEREKERESQSQNAQAELPVPKVRSFSLAERIKDVLMKHSEHPESRDDVLKLFTTGVILPERIFHQPRIQNARTGLNFVYCPNSIITGQIFSIMSPNPPYDFITKNRFILKGYKGISKTVSTSLLWQLTQFIDEYRFHERYNQELIKEEFKQPKIVYWSIDEYDTEESVHKNLIEQSPELKDLFTLEDFLKKQIKFRDIYREKFGIKVYLALDQIQSLAKLHREL